MCTLFVVSVRLKAPPMACPEKVREPIQGQLVIIPFPVRLKLPSCVSEIKIVGAMGSGFAVELNVPP